MREMTKLEFDHALTKTLNENKNLKAELKRLKEKPGLFARLKGLFRKVKC